MTGNFDRCRAQVNVLWGSGLNDAAAVQHGDPVTQSHRFLIVLRDINHRRPPVAQQARKFQAHLEPQFRIHVAQGVVQQQDIRIGYQGAGQGSALFLSV